VPEALDAIQVHSPPPVILTDIAMPHQDGYDLLRQARAVAAPEAPRSPRRLSVPTLASTNGRGGSRRGSRCTWPSP
jgi:CheY-like chemotaxis protein